MQKWYFQLMGQTIGPLSSSELRARAKKGEISADTLVRRGEEGAWHPANSIAGLITPKHSAASKEEPVKESYEDHSTPAVEAPPPTPVAAAQPSPSPPTPPSPAEPPSRPEPQPAPDNNGADPFPTLRTLINLSYALGFIGATICALLAIVMIVSQEPGVAALLTGVPFGIVGAVWVFGCIAWAESMELALKIERTLSEIRDRLPERPSSDFAQG